MNFLSAAARSLLAVALLLGARAQEPFACSTEDSGWTTDFPIDVSNHTATGSDKLHVYKEPRSVMQINLTNAFPFFGETYDRMWLSAYGYVRFQEHEALAGQLWDGGYSKNKGYDYQDSAAFARSLPRIAFFMTSFMVNDCNEEDNVYVHEDLEEKLYIISFKNVYEWDDCGRKGDQLGTYFQVTMYLNGSVSPGKVVFDFGRTNNQYRDDDVGSVVGMLSDAKDMISDAIEPLDMYGTWDASRGWYLASPNDVFPQAGRRITCAAVTAEPTAAPTAAPTTAAITANRDGPGGSATAAGASDSRAWYLSVITLSGCSLVVSLCALRIVWRERSAAGEARPSELDTKAFPLDVERSSSFPLP